MKRLFHVPGLRNPALIDCSYDVPCYNANFIWRDGSPYVHDAALYWRVATNNARECFFFNGEVFDDDVCSNLRPYVCSHLVP